MKKKEIIQKLKEILVYKLDVNLKMDEIKLDVPLFEGGLGLDSISIVNLIGLIEENFNIRFQDDEVSMDLFVDLNTLSDFIEKKTLIEQ